MISFVRVDDRMIHGQTVTRWSLEYPCTGLIAVNDAAAKNPVLKGAYKSASDKKTFVWAVDEFIAKAPKVLESKDKYFLITKNSKLSQRPATRSSSHFLKRPRSATGRSSEASSVTQTDRICKIDTRKGERNVHKFISGNYSRIIRFPLQYAWSGRNIHR